MSSITGIRVGDDLKQAFAAAQDASSDTRWIKVEIADEKEFRTSGLGGNKADDLEKTFTEAAKQLVEKKPAFILIRKGELWLIVFYMSDLCQARFKMMYAASLGGLKEGLGGAKFLGELHISEISHCNAAYYENHIRKRRASEIMTMDEVEARQAHLESHLAMGTAEISLGLDMPLNVGPTAEAAFRDFKDRKVNSAVMFLDAQEVLTCEHAKDLKTSELGAFQGKEPRFSLHRFEHNDREGKAGVKNVFIYYCPDGARPKLKMMYSTTKAVCMKLIEKAGVTIDKHLETSSASDIKDDWFMDALYPQAHKRTDFAKPKKPGKAASAPKSKFQA